MEIEENVINGTSIATIREEGLVTNEATEIMEIAFESECDKIIFHAEMFGDDFFDLKTRVAGGVLQKFSNYNLTVAIVGDFSRYHSESLNSFIVESNKDRTVFFS